MTDNDSKTSDEITELLGDESALLWNESSDNHLRAQDLFGAASKYMDYSPQKDFSSIGDFVDWTYGRMDKLISEDKARAILQLLNGYVRRSHPLRAKTKRMYGEREKYRAITKLFWEIEQLDVDNIWDLKAKDQKLFCEVAKVANRDNQALLERPAIAHQALLRFYVASQLEKLECAGINDESILTKFLNEVLAASKALSVMEECARLSDREYLSRLSNEAKQHATYNSEYKDACELAEEAWRFGCKLLHTQMAELITGVLDLHSDKYKRVLKELKKVTGARLKGPGLKREIDSCLCSKAAQCPIAQRYNITDNHPLK